MFLFGDIRGQPEPPSSCGFNCPVPVDFGRVKKPCQPESRDRGICAQFWGGKRCGRLRPVGLSSMWPLLISHCGVSDNLGGLSISVAPRPITRCTPSVPQSPPTPNLVPPPPAAAAPGSTPAVVAEGPLEIADLKAKDAKGLSQVEGKERRAPRVGLVAPRTARWAWSARRWVGWRRQQSQRLWLRVCLSVGAASERERGLSLLISGEPAADCFHSWCSPSSLRVWTLS